MLGLHLPVLCQLFLAEPPSFSIRDAEKHSGVPGRAYEVPQAMSSLHAKGQNELACVVTNIWPN